MEIWKPVLGYEKFYEVSDKGRVRSKTRKTNGSHGLRTVRGKLLGDDGHGYGNRYGYRHVQLCDERGQFGALIHRLVCESFVRPLEDGEVVMHLNDITHDNRLENLRIGSQSDNIRDCIQKKRFNAGHSNRVKTHCPLGHALAGDNMRKAVKRACRSCHRAHSRVYDAKRRRGIDISDQFAEIADQLYAETSQYQSDKEAT